METTELERYFTAIRDRFQENAAIRGTSSRTFNVAGVTIKMEFADEDLAERLTSSLAPLAVDDSVQSCDWRFMVWDDRWPNARPPYPLKRHSNHTFHTGEFLSSERHKVLTELAPSRLTVMDMQDKVGLHWFHDRDALPWYLYCKPLLTLFGWAFYARGIPLIHAAAVGDGSSCVLIAGAKGAGKSTLALSCLTAGFDYLGDDLVLVAPDGNCHGLYYTAKLEDLDLLSGLAEVAKPQSEGRVTIDVAKHFAPQVRTALPVKAIVLPSRTAGATGCEVIENNKVLKEIVGSTLFQIQGAGVDEFFQLYASVRKLPCYRLAVSNQLELMHAALRDCLARTDVSALK